MILITGGAGYIGSHVNMILNEKGYETLVIDNLSTGSKYLAKWGHFIKGDIGNTKLMDEIFSTYSIDCVMHFAASAYVGESMQNPKKYYINNMKKSLDLLNSMIKNVALPLQSKIGRGVAKLTAKRLKSREIGFLRE